MYGCETWATTKYLLFRLDAFDTWALRTILRIPYTRIVSNSEVTRTTGCSPLSYLVTNRRLRLFGHTARSSPREDHHRALAACIWQVPPDWKRPAGRPSHTWLRARSASGQYCPEADLGPLNFGLATAWRKIMLCYVPCYCSLELTLRCMRVGGPGERPLLETNGDILWTQQHSSGVRSERRMSYVHQQCKVNSVTKKLLKFNMKNGKNV